MSETLLLTPRESAAYRRCSIRKQDRERAEGRGPRYVRIDGRIFYRRSDLDDFIERHICGGELGDADTAAPKPRQRGRQHKNAGETVTP